MSTASSISTINQPTHQQTNSQSSSLSSSSSNNNIAASAASSTSLASNNNNLNNTNNNNNNNSNDNNKSKKYSAFNINNIYKGKSLENPKTSVIVPKHGLQTVGKVGAGRRVPPSANIGPLKTGTNTDTTSAANNNEGDNLVNIVPAGGQGWPISKEEESSSSSSSSVKDSKENSLSPIETCQPQKSSAIVNNDQISSAAASITTTTDYLYNNNNNNNHPPLNVSYPQNQPTPASNNDVSDQHYRDQSYQQFSEEFPPISGGQEPGGNGGGPQDPPNKLAKDVSLNLSRKESIGLDQQPQKPPPLLPLPQSKDHHHQQQQQQQKITAQCGYPHLSNYGHIDGGCEKEKSTNDVFTNSNENSYNNNNNVRNKIGHVQSQHHSSSSSSSSNSLTSYGSSSQQQTATGSGTATKPSQQQPINTTELFSLPTSSDHLYSSTNSNRLNNDRNRQQQPYPSNSSNQMQARRNKPEPKPKFVMEKPAIIDDQELKNLDKILKTDMECDWALEQEIDYSAKIEFSDNDSDEELDKAKQQPKNQTADRSKSGSRSTESNNLLKYPESEESSHSHQQHRYNLLTRDSNSTNASRSAEHQSDSGYYGGGSHAPPPQKSMAPPPNVMDQQMNNRYYGRKSDPSYESMMRKDNEHYEKGGYGRRGGAGEYHSSRSQQLPRGGGSSGGYNATPAQAYSKGPSSNFNVQPPPPPPPPIQIQSRAGPAMEPVKKSEEEQDYWPKRIKKDANSGGPRDKSEDDDSVMAPPPQILQSNNNRDKRDYRSGGNNISGGGGGGPSMYSKPATYPPPNLPPRLLKQAEMMNNAKNTNCYDNRDTQRGRRSPLQSMDRESRDYISNERHNRRTPPEYDNMGRRYKSTISGNGGHSNEPSNWRKQVMPPPPTAVAQHLSDRRNSAAETSESVPKKLLVHGAETDGILQTKRETNDTSNKTLVAAAAGEDSKKPEPEQSSSKDVAVVAKSSSPSQPIRQNNDIKSAEISSEPKITILEKPTEKTNSPSPKPTSVLTGSSAEVKNSSDDLNRPHHHHHQPSHQHHHQQQQQQPIIRNSRSFNNTSHTGSSQHMKQNVDVRKMNVASGGGGRYSNETVDRNRGTPPATHQQPQRKYSNNSSERFTPPSVSCLLSSNSSAKPNDTVSYNRRDYSQTGGGYSNRNTSTSHNQNQHPAAKFNDSSVGKHDSGSGKQLSTSIGHGEGGNRSRQESFQSSNSKAPSVAAVPVQQSSVVIVQQQTTTAIIAASTSVAPTTAVYAPSSVATEKRAPPAPVRATTTYGPPPTNIAKVFGDVPSASSSPPIMHHQQQSNEVKQQSSNTNAPLKSTPPPAQLSPSSTSSNSNQQAPRHPQSATGKQQPSSESRGSNRLVSGGRYRTGRDSIKPQRSSGGGPSLYSKPATKPNVVTVANPKSVSSQSTGSGSINAPVQQKSQDPQEDLNNDEWETASESSDLMERSTNLLSNNNRKSNENEKAVASSPTVSSGQSPPQTSSISVTQPPKHSSDRTIYSSKTTISNTSESHAKAPPSAHPPAPSSSSSSVHPRHEQNRRDATRFNDSYGHHYSGPRSHYGSSSNSMMHHGSSYRGSSSRGLGSNTGKSSYRNGPAPPPLPMNSKRQHSQTSGDRGGYSYHQQERRQPQESISNQMSKMSLDHHPNDSYGGKMQDDDTRRHRKNSANQSREDYAMDHHSYDDDDCGKKANNQQRANPKLAKQRKERSKSKNQGNRSSEQSQSPGAPIASKESQSGSNMEQQPINKDQRAEASKDPKCSNNSNPQQKQPMKSTSVVSTGQQQQESNVESLGGDQPRPASTSTSQRSSPKVEETKCATGGGGGGGNKSAQQPQTMVGNDSQSLTPCSSNSLKKTESPLNISKIPDMDTSTNIISNRKIVGTLIYENTKLKEENKVLSKIEEVVPATSAQNNSTITVVSNINTNTTSQSINSKGFSSSLTTSSSSSTINEELNMRIASVKKVWDSAPSNDHQSSSNVVSTGDSTVDPRKNSMLASNSNSGLMSSGSPIEKTFDQKSKSSSSSNNNMPVNMMNNNNNVQNRKQSNFNLMLNNGSNQMVSMNNATSPPVVDLNRSYVSNNSTGTFHQNAAVIQTPTSPPTLSQMYGPQNLAANLAYVHQMAATADQLNFGAAPGQPNQLAQVYPAPHAAFMQQGTLAAAAAAAHQQNPFNAMATALMTNNPQGTPHNPANMFMAQLTQTQPGALVHDHQYNKFALAPNNLIKPFVHPNQTSGGQMNNLQSTSWPGVQQQVSAGPNQFYAAANPMASHFVQNPLNPNAVTVPGSAMIPSTTSSGSQVGNQAVSAANAFNNRQPNSLSRNNSMVMDNGQSSSNAMRSFMGPGGNQNAVTGATMSMNDIHHSHHHANQMAAAHHQMSNNASHFMNDQSVGVGRGPAQQQLNMHHAHRNQFANTNQQNMNAAAAAAAAVAASNWTNNQQMFFNHQKLPNGRQFPMHLISQPMINNANNAAALAAAAQLNPRTSPLNVQAATALMNNSNYPNPIQRPSGSNSGQAQSKGGNRNNGSNKSSFSSNNNNMGKSRQYQNNNSNNNSNNNINNNNNRSSSTPSPGTNVGAASVANSMSANTVSSTVTAGVNMITDQSTTVSNKD